VIPGSVRDRLPVLGGLRLTAVELVVASFQADGRLLYIGAGTSGRLGILDASECPPTFGVSPDRVVGVIAGGRDTVFLSREGVEDDEDAARNDVGAKTVAESDTVIGITASRRTPYVMAGLGEAKRRGASTVLVTCNPPTEVDVDVQINLVVGPEAITGSTRLKAGTAQKMTLNMITTASMVKLGKVYENLMVDVRPTSAKLKERAKGLVMLRVAEPHHHAGHLEDRGGDPSQGQGDPRRGSEAVRCRDRGQPDPARWSSVPRR